MQIPRFSVIVPVYKAETTIHRCVDSLLAGCPADAEIILVNDGSPDGSGEICRAYVQTHPQIRLIDKENGGVSTARNAGLDAARGEYVCFVDSDDYVSPDYFDEIRQALAEVDWELIRFSHCVDDGKSVQDRRSAAFAARTRQDVLPKLQDDICNKSINSPWAKVYRKEIIDRYAIRFPVGASMAEDRAFNVSYGLHVSRYLVSDRVIYCLDTQNMQSLSRKKHADLDAQFQITNRYMTSAIDEADIPEEEKERFRSALNFGDCRSIYREAKDLRRDRVGWLGRQKALWQRCREINRRHMRYPNTRYCRRITLPVRLYLTPVIDAAAWKLSR